MEAFFDLQIEMARNKLSDFGRENIIKNPVKFGDPLENVENQYRRNELPEIYKQPGETKLDFAATPNKRQSSETLSFQNLSPTFHRLTLLMAEWEIWRRKKIKTTRLAQAFLLSECNPTNQ